MPQNENTDSPSPDNAAPLALMQGYRAVVEFQFLASYSLMHITVVSLEGELPHLLHHWRMRGNSSTASFVRRVKRAESGVGRLAAEAMERESVILMHEAGRLRAYKIAARAHARRLMTGQDLANIGIGLTREQRHCIAVSVAMEMAS